MWIHVPNSSNLLGRRTGRDVGLDDGLGHDAKMPDKLLDKAVLATKLLIESEHTQDFDEPGMRKRELRKHLRQFEKFKPKFRFARGKIAKMPKRAVVKKVSPAGNKTKVSAAKKTAKVK